MTTEPATTLPLASLLQSLQLERFTGCVDLGNPGQIWLIEGEVVRASWFGHSGLPALLTLLLIPKISYQLTNERPAPGAILVSSSALTTMISRVARDWAHLSVLVLKSVEEAPTAPSAPARAVMTRLDGTRTLAEAVVEADVPPAAVIHHVAGCVQAGLLTVVSGPHPQRASPDWLSAPDASLDPDSHEPDSTAEVIYTAEVPMPQSRWVQEVLERTVEEAPPSEPLAPQPRRRPGQVRYIAANVVASVLFVIAAISLIWVFLVFRPLF